MQLATHGFTVVNINYRLTTEEVFPACLLDIFAALNWVLKNGKEHFADADKLCIAGDSAGGHLAFTTANVIQNPALQEELGVSFDGKVSALGLICGALDLERYIKLRAFRGYQELVFGQDFMNNPARHIGIPYNYLTKDLPPVYLVSSDKDFARASTLDIKPRLEKLGVPHLCRYITGKTKHKLIHVFNVIHPEWEESIEVNKEMCDFFKKYV
jgi:acetyl esterase/lipase